MLEQFPLCFSHNGGMSSGKNAEQAENKTADSAIHASAVLHLNLKAIVMCIAVSSCD